MEGRSLVTAKICPSCKEKYSPDLERCPTDDSLLAVVRRDPFIGRLVAERYQIEEVLGKGGFSTVYKARQKSLNRDVAIKILAAQFVDNPEKIRRFQQEAETISGLIHSNIAGVFDYGVLPEGQPYLVMEFLDGKTLGQLIASEGCIEPEKAVELFIQICEGISVAHSRGLIHRDIKPANIVFIEGEDGNLRAKILDFGLAKVMIEDDLHESLTKTGEVVGTPSYMSPEQCRGDELDCRSDIYSLGCLFYAALTGGKLAISGETSFEVMSNHLTEKPLPISKHTTGVPSRLERIVARALKKDPDDRYQSVEDLQDALKGVEPSIWQLQKETLFPSKEKLLTKKQKRLRKKILLGAWAIALALVGTIGLLSYENLQANKFAQIRKEHENKTVVFSHPPVEMIYSDMLTPESRRDDSATEDQFHHRIYPYMFIALKSYDDNSSPLEIAKNQLSRHEGYLGFLETQPLHEIKIGRGGRIKAIESAFLSTQWDGSSELERHVYFGEPGRLFKLKLGCPRTRATEGNKIFNQTLMSVVLAPAKDAEDISPRTSE